jgi:hypothetical protein
MGTTVGVCQGAFEGQRGELLGRIFASWVECTVGKGTPIAGDNPVASPVVVSVLSDIYLLLLSSLPFSTSLLLGLYLGSTLPLPRLYLAFTFFFTFCSTFYSSSFLSNL